MAQTLHISFLQIGQVIQVGKYGEILYQYGSGADMSDTGPNHSADINALFWYR